MTPLLHLETNQELSVGPDGKVPNWIQLLPSGAEILGADGRKFKNPDPKALIEAFQEYHQDLPLDWNHQSEKESEHQHGPNPAPAAGWIVELQEREGAIWGRVEWTERGAASVAAREYRYVSPAFMRTKDGHVVHFVSAALENRPNLRLKALNRTESQKPEVTPMKAKLLKVLGLETNATDDEAFEAVTELNAATEKLKSELEVAQRSAATPDLRKFVPRADYDLEKQRAADLAKEIADQKAEKLETELNREIDDALKAGKITPASKYFYIETCRQDGGLERFREFLKTAPVIGEPTDLGNRKPPAEKHKAMTDIEKEVCRNMGMSEEEFLKAKNEDE